MECAAKGSAGAGPCAPGRPSRRCGLCGAVAYCSPSHQMLHWNDHRDECARLQEQMRMADTLNDFPFTFSEEASLLRSGEQMTRCSLFMSKGLHQRGLWTSECSCGPTLASIGGLGIMNDWNLPSSLCPCTDPKNPISTPLSSWKDYYKWRSLPFHSPVALLLHWPLTIYHCLQLSFARNSSSEVSGKLHIHYLGPEKELLQLAVFGELRALFPGLQLYIEIVGPAVPQCRDGETICISNYAHCSEESCHCRSSERTNAVMLRLRKGYYHDRYTDIVKQDSNPHLIVAPNAGVAAYSSWLPTIELIKEMGVPAIFTDFCEEAAFLASRCISSVTGRPLSLPIQINPFRQPMAVEDSALYLPCYSNCFIFGM
ncbi:zinc finger MYND domain-containing protein 15 isoform X1 [Ananas comosus]|uniref:Zinc finger MYND domain-containing protein 15 isoform X1 n=1 Tax=Ananas comosus TaxID=4615 RepID=A0A6P5FK08_ANACO|nr:zinc finger MYND domain-containing protein 15 isoform X1 [Ananas comosus]